VCVCVCVCARAHVRARVCLHACVQACACMRVHECEHSSVHVCTHAYARSVCVHPFAHGSMRACTHLQRAPCAGAGPTHVMLGEVQLHLSLAATSACLWGPLGEPVVGGRAQWPSGRIDRTVRSYEHALEGGPFCLAHSQPDQAAVCVGTPLPHPNPLQPRWPTRRSSRCSWGGSPTMWAPTSGTCRCCSAGRAVLGGCMLRPVGTVGAPAAGRRAIPPCKQPLCARGLIPPPLLPRMRWWGSVKRQSGAATPPPWTATCCTRRARTSRCDRPQEPVPAPFVRGLPGL